ncbi:MAG: thiamine pyrophosphate-binding protein [Candidatus Tectomicrobia bacterium]|uniref:Thiamine pyrophosphate-binding protein n=1 Tax=Tectimicrobiota bacterium TaxID=2528274 RepID=A0A932HYV2_UNCTE|nr:thiamine pyrophosphate-binding protein [Candidatus Tectomicrobia bacterium]
MIERMDLLRAVQARRTNEIVVMTMTTTLQWPLVSRHELDFDFLAFGMGHAADFGMGLAMARPERKTIVFKGDGGLLMSLGSLVTYSAYAPGNLLILLLENHTYEMVGGQPLPPRADFFELARAAGFHGGGATGKGKVERIGTLAEFEAQLPRLLAEEGPHFVVLPVTNKEPLPPVAHTDHAGRVRNLRKALGVV